MASSKGQDTTMSGKAFVVARVLDAPRDLVFKVCTEKEHMAHWWGPKGFALDIVKFEMHPGGTFLYKMSAPNGFEMWGKWIMREVVEPERIVAVTSFSDPEGGITRHPMSADWPLETLSTMTFEERDGKTVYTIEAKPINAGETEHKTFEDGFESMKGGYGGTLDQLEAYLKTLG